MKERIPKGSPRKLLTRSQRQRLLAAYQGSDLTQKAFAQRHGIGYSTLGKWLREQRHQWPTHVQLESSGLTEVTVDPMAAPTVQTIEVMSPRGWIARVPASLSAATLRGVLGVLPC